MGYSITNTFQTLSILDAAHVQGIRYVCFFAFDDRPSNKKRIDKIESFRYWIDQLSAEFNTITLLFSRSEIQYASTYRPIRFESWLQIDPYKERLMELNKLYINPTFLIAQSLGIKTDDLPGIVLFEMTSLRKAKFRKIPIEVFDANSDQTIEPFLLSVYKSLDSQDGWEDLDFDIDYFRSKSQEILDNLNPIVEPISQILPFEDRKKIKVFISYASEDRKIATKIYFDLKEVGFDPWMDIYNLTAGELWDHKIKRLIDQADFFLACLSKESVGKRGYIQREFKKALELWESKLSSDIYLIPIKIDNCEIPQEFKQFQWIDYSYRTGFSKIVQSIEEGVKRKQG